MNPRAKKCGYCKDNKDKLDSTLKQIKELVDDLTSRNKETMTVIIEGQPYICKKS